MSDCTRNKIRKRNKKDLKKKISEYKISKGCFICGESHPSCLEFHHLDKSEKETEICKMFTRYTEQEIINEIQKCEVICSNCHRKLHWEETR